MAKVNAHAEASRQSKDEEDAEICKTPLRHDESDDLSVEEVEESDKSIVPIQWKTVGLKISMTIGIFVAVSVLLERYAEEEVSAGSQWLMDKVGLPGLFLAVFVADGVPQPFTYVPLIFLAVKGSAAKLAVFIVCSLASYAAALLGYVVGATIRTCGCGDRVFQKLEQDYPVVKPLMETKGSLGVALCAVLPVPLAIATWTAGAFQVGFPQFLLAAACRAPKAHQRRGWQLGGSRRRAMPPYAEDGRASVLYVGGMRSSSEEEDEDPQQPLSNRTRPWRFVVAALAGTAALAALVPSLQPLLGRRGPATLLPGDLPEQKASPQYWLMCPSGNMCGQQRMMQWQQNPATLADAVAADLHWLPGVKSQAYGQVVSRWEASPPTFRGTQITLRSIASFMQEVLRGDAFGTGTQVPYVDFQGPGDSKVVAITQRQLAFIVANALMGNGLVGASNGLSAALDYCAGRNSAGHIYSLLSLLAVLSQELTEGQHGTVLVGLTPRPQDDSWREKLNSMTLQAPTLCIDFGEGSNCGMADFMAGGTPNQALTDIAGGVVGGGGNLCGVEDSQDESLVQFYSEVLAFSFFASSHKMLPVPWTLLGSRSYMKRISGTSESNGNCGHILDENWLNDDIQGVINPVMLNGATAYLYAGSFVAVASLGGEQCPVQQAKNNQCASQRRHLEKDVALWYQAFSPEMYNEVARPAFRSVLTRIGTGPWGAGVWWGDSHQSFLAVWIATALLGGTTLDYYVYSHFCENPGNQCFVLGADGCRECIARGGNNVDASYCGAAGVKDVVARFQGRPAAELFGAASQVGNPPAQVFDQLATHAGGAAPAPQWTGTALQ